MRSDKHSRHEPLTIARQRYLNVLSFRPFAVNSCGRFAGPVRPEFAHRGASAGCRSRAAILVGARGVAYGDKETVCTVVVEMTPLLRETRACSVTPATTSATVMQVAAMSVHGVLKQVAKPLPRLRKHPVHPFIFGDGCIGRMNHIQLLPQMACVVIVEPGGPFPVVRGRPLKAT